MPVDERYIAFDIHKPRIAPQGAAALFDPDAQSIITSEYVYVLQGPALRADIPLNLIDGLAIERLRFYRWSVGKRAIYASSGRPTTVVMRLRTPLKVMNVMAHDVTSVAVEVTDPQAYLSALAVATGVEPDPA
jgi:hypothetical protein